MLIIGPLWLIAIIWFVQYLASNTRGARKRQRDAAAAQQVYISQTIADGVARGLTAAARERETTRNHLPVSSPVQENWDDKWKRLDDMAAARSALWMQSH
jgi:hypothetical protein